MRIDYFIHDSDDYWKLFSCNLGWMNCSDTLRCSAVLITTVAKGQTDWNKQIVKISQKPWASEGIWRFPSIGVPPVILHFSRILSINRPFWGPISGNPQVSSLPLPSTVHFPKDRCLPAATEATRSTGNSSGGALWHGQCVQLSSGEKARDSHSDMDRKVLIIYHYLSCNFTCLFFKGFL